MTFGGSADAINANASFGFNANQNHTTGILQKKVIYAFPYCNVINHKKRYNTFHQVFYNKKFEYQHSGWI